MPKVSEKSLEVLIPCLGLVPALWVDSPAVPAPPGADSESSRMKQVLFPSAAHWLAPAHTRHLNIPTISGKVRSWVMGLKVQQFLIIRHPVVVCKCFIQVHIESKSRIYSLMSFPQCEHTHV